MIISTYAASHDLCFHQYLLAPYIVDSTALAEVMCSLNRIPFSVVHSVLLHFALFASTCNSIADLYRKDFLSEDWYSLCVLLFMLLLQVRPSKFATFFYGKEV